jgi:hypothetical protein
MSPHPVTLRSNLAFSSRPRVDIPSDLLLCGFPTKTLYAFLSCPMLSTCPAHLIFRGFIIVILFDEEYDFRSSSLHSFTQRPIISSLLDLDILRSTLFSNTLSVRDQVSHPYRTTGRIIVFRILIFMFLDSRREDKRF